ncbi:MAG: undecaprenyl-diphosphate phosphatase [Chlamydiales bacterium]
MTYLEALVMGILQGVTEFLPVSSSAHLKLAKILFGVEEGEGLVVFDLVCHLGTLTALAAFFWSDIVALFRTERRKISLLIIATLPLVPFYFLLKPVRDFASQSNYLGFFLILTAMILFAGSHFRFKRAEAITFRSRVTDALWIGAMQATALIPGISRSASTISCAQVLGWEAREAVRFSFLLSIPTILGGNAAECLKLMVTPVAPLSLSFSCCAIGFLSSGLVGFAVIRFAVRFLEKGDLRPFAWYCLILGVVTTVCLLSTH